MIISKNDPKLTIIKKRGEILEGDYLRTASEIVSRVKNEGDAALFELTAKYDGFDVNSENVLVSGREYDEAFSAVPQDLLKAIGKAKRNILSFHEKQVEKTWLTECADGVILGQKITPLEKAGVYVPGGKAAYFSSVMMNILPAVAAGVKDITMCTPASGGKINPALLVTAKICGAKRVFKLGGAQAIAAMAYGTNSVPKVDKITGPGNIYVAMAKKLVFGAVDIDMIAGPSEILVIADSSADPACVAADMLAQCEHDEMASAVCLTDDGALAEKVNAEIKKQLAVLPKKSIAEVSLSKFSAIVIVSSIDEACLIANDIAPEHLELYLTSPMEHMMKIKNAGAIFLGGNSPEAIGDYFAGPNHVLPTGGTARFFSPLGAYDFMKRSSIIYYSPEGLCRDAGYIKTMALAENLSAHAESVNVRVK